MKKNKLDSIIKDKLSEQQMSFDKMDWLDMNERLNEEFGPDNTIEENRDFDQSIRQKLKNEEAAFQEAHWQMLIDRLEEEEDRRIKVIIIDVLKYTAILLLLLSVWNWQGNSYLHKILEKETVHIASSEIPLMPSENLDVHSNENRDTEINAVHVVSEGGNLDQIKVSSTTPTYSSILNQISSQNGINRSVSFPAQENTSVSTTSEQSTGRDEISEVQVAEFVDDLPLLSSLETADINFERENEKLLTIGLPLLNILPAEKEKTKISMNAIMSRDLYLIRSPEDPIYPLPSYLTDSKGLSGGLTMSLERNNLEFETGLMYATVTYAPRAVTEQYSQRGGFFETSLENISFNMVCIPINFKYHFDAGKRGSFFTNFGASFNGIVNSNFDTYDKFIAPQLTPAPANFDDESLLSQKDFEPGLLDGGSIFDNTFFTLDIGIGYRYQFSNKFAAYVQPTIQTQFTDGLGPNEDSLHKLSLNTGIKYLFN